MSLLFGFWRLPTTLGNNTGNTLGNKQKISMQKILYVLRERNKKRIYNKNKEKNKYKPVITLVFFKIPSYYKLLNGVPCPCFCHDHDNMCYIKEGKLCKTCPCWFFKTLI